MFLGVDEGVGSGIQLAAFFTTHTHDHLLSQFGYAAVFAFVMVESLGGAVSGRDDADHSRVVCVVDPSP
jgi:hypothetical protein